MDIGTKLEIIFCVLKALICYLLVSTCTSKKSSADETYLFPHFLGVSWSFCVLSTLRSYGDGLHCVGHGSTCGKLSRHWRVCFAGIRYFASFHPPPPVLWLWRLLCLPVSRGIFNIEPVGFAFPSAGSCERKRSPG